MGKILGEPFRNPALLDRLETIKSDFAASADKAVAAAGLKLAALGEKTQKKIDAVDIRIKKPVISALPLLDLNLRF